MHTKPPYDPSTQKKIKIVEDHRFYRPHGQAEIATELPLRPLAYPSLHTTAIVDNLHKLSNTMVSHLIAIAY